LEDEWNERIIEDGVFLSDE